MGMHLAVAGIDHQPFHVRFVDELLKQPLPDTAVAPPAEPPVRVLPVTVAGRKIAPGCTRAQNPEDSVEKTAIVVRDTPPIAHFAQEDAVQEAARRYRTVVSSCAFSHCMTQKR